MEHAHHKHGRKHHIAHSYAIGDLRHHTHSAENTADQATQSTDEATGQRRIRYLQASYAMRLGTVRQVVRNPQ